MTLKQAYSYAIQFLEKNGVDEAEFKALCTVCDVAGIKNSAYAAHLQDEVLMSRLADKLWRLKTGEPLQYVLGKWDFYESEFFVGEGVLIPRPETEELVALAIQHILTLHKPLIFDLCSGSGCIGISLAKKTDGTVYLLEKSEQALFYLKKNAKDVANVQVLQADITLPPAMPLADVIICNPPYIKTGSLATLQSEVRREPVLALDGGKDGLDFYRIINNIWADKLKKNGRLFLEIGNDQGKAVPDILTNFTNIRVLKDMYQNDRMIVADKG